MPRAAAKKVVVEEEVEVEEPEQIEVEAEPVASDNSSDNGDGTKKKRHVRTPVERIDNIIELLAGIKVPKTVTKELEMLRKQLDGAKLKAAPRTRVANSYNEFIQKKMPFVKAENPDKKSSELFAMCIQLWRESKAGAAAEAE